MNLNFNCQHHFKHLHSNVKTRPDKFISNTAKDLDLDKITNIQNLDGKLNFRFLLLNSMGAERSFSILGNVLSDNGTRFQNDTIKQSCLLELTRLLVRNPSMM